MKVNTKLQVRLHWNITSTDKGDLRELVATITIPKCFKLGTSDRDNMVSSLAYILDNMEVRLEHSGE